MTKNGIPSDVNIVLFYEYIEGVTTASFFRSNLILSNVDIA